MLLHMLNDLAEAMKALDGKKGWCQNQFSLEPERPKHSCGWPDEFQVWWCRHEQRTDIELSDLDLSLLLSLWGARQEFLDRDSWAVYGKGRDKFEKSALGWLVARLQFQCQLCSLVALQMGNDTLGCIWKINGMENDLMRIHWLDLRPCFSAVDHRKKKRVTSIHHQWLSLFVFRMCIQVSVVICLCDVSLVLFQLVQFTRIPRTWRRVCFV